MSGFCYEHIIVKSVNKSTKIVSKMSLTLHLRSWWIIWNNIKQASIYNRRKNIIKQPLFH